MFKNMKNTWRLLIAIFALARLITVACNNGTIDDDLAAPVITTSSLAPGQIGLAYNQALAANGTTLFTWAIASGTLPEGLHLAPGGAISGTPAADVHSTNL